MTEKTISIFWDNTSPEPPGCSSPALSGRLRDVERGAAPVPAWAPPSSMARTTRRQSGAATTDRLFWSPRAASSPASVLLSGGLEPKFPLAWIQSRLICHRSCVCGRRALGQLPLIFCFLFALLLQFLPSLLRRIIRFRHIVALNFCDQGIKDPRPAQPRCRGKRMLKTQVPGIFY
jgi:hypothetical protein